MQEPVIDKVQVINAGSKYLTTTLIKTLKNMENLVNTEHSKLWMSCLKLHINSWVDLDI